MPGEPSEPQPDHALIVINESYEVSDWSDTLGVTEEELRKAIAVVGGSLERVREYLRLHT